jgi:hypothetical protein
MSTINLVPEGFRQKKEKTSKKLVIIPIVLIIITAIICAGLFFYEETLSNKISDLDNEIDQINQKISNELDTEVISFQKHLNNLKKMLDDHIYYSNLFSLIEKTTVPTVSFESFNGDVSSKKIQLKGKAISFSSLAKQIVAFREAEEIDKVNFSSASIGTDGGIGFDLSLFLKQEMFEYKN